MAKQPFDRIIRTSTAEERARHAAIRAAVETEFPAAPKSMSTPVSGIAAQIRQAREARGLTWFALANLAGLATSSVIRDIEDGQDAQLSDLQAVAKVLGLRLELVAEPV